MEPREEIGNSVKQTVREGAYGLKNVTRDPPVRDLGATDLRPRGHQSVTSGPPMCHLGEGESRGWESGRGGDRAVRERPGRGDVVAPPRIGKVRLPAKSALFAKIAKMSGFW